MNKNTSGPWGIGPRISEPGKIDRIPVGPLGRDYTVASIHCYGENADANAHLIAAAPELLELAKYVKGCLDETGECIIKLGQPMDHIVSKLVAKAEGSRK